MATVRDSILKIRVSAGNLPNKPSIREIKDQILAECSVALSLIDVPLPPPPPPAPVTLKRVVVSPATKTVKVGEGAAFTAQGEYSDGSFKPVVPVWSATVGTVSAAGQWIGSATAGAVTVKAVFGGLLGTSLVTVQEIVAPPPPPPPPPPEPEPEPPPPPPPSAGVIYRDTFADGKHSPSTGGFFYNAPALGAGEKFTLQKDEQGRDVYRLTIPADANDNRNEQRFGGFGRKTKLFVGFRRRMSPNFTHENMEGPDNWKQLRLFSNPYETAGGIHVGFSLLPGSGGAGNILFELVSNAANGSRLNVADNKGTWDRVAVPGAMERWGFWVQLASGPGMKDGKIQFWLDGVDLIQRQMDKVRAQGGTPFNWHALDLWNYMAGARNYFDAGFYPGWDNAGSTNPEWLDYHEFVLADSPLPEYVG